MFYALNKNHPVIRPQITMEVTQWFFIRANKFGLVTKITNKAKVASFLKNQARYVGQLFFSYTKQ